nr:MAG TPA: hypothetical protein [Bacteriophage sp.]
MISKICLSNLLAFSDKLCVKNFSENFEKGIDMVVRLWYNT